MDVGFSLQSLTTPLKYVSFCAEILAATSSCRITVQRKHPGYIHSMYQRYIIQIQPSLLPPPYPNTAQADCTDLCNVWIIPDAYICPYLFVLKVVFTDYQIKKVYLKSDCFFVLYNFVTHHEAIIN